MASEDFLDRIAHWAETREDVRAAVLIGSHTRVDHPADAFSDIDLVLFARDPDPLLDDGSWSDELGDAAITFVEQTAAAGIRERRVLFRDGTDVDFAVIPVERSVELAETGSDVLARGHRVLVDKDGLTRALAGVRPRTSLAPHEHELAARSRRRWTSSPGSHARPVTSWVTRTARTKRSSRGGSRGRRFADPGSIAWLCNVAYSLPKWARPPMREEVR